MSLESTISATSSQGSAGGPWHCDGPALKACPESGQAPAPASRLAAPGEEREPKTNATCGQPSETSSELAGLPLFSGSKSQALPLSERLGRALARRLARFGSMEFEATWSQRATPLGLRYWAHIPSARRTGGKGCIGWPTPQANKSTKNSRDPKRMKENGSQTCLADAAHLAGWPTPQEDNANNSAGHKGTAFSDLPTTAQLASWPTPQAHDTQQQGQARELTATGRIKTHTGSDVSANLPMMAGWATPRATDAKCGDTYTENCEGKDLAKDASMVAWATPRAEDAESAGMRHSRGVADTLSAQAGQDASRSIAATGRPAGFRLNPRFSLWLMGYPAEWASCGERAMQSCRSARRSS